VGCHPFWPGGRRGEQRDEREGEGGKQRDERGGADGVVRS